MNEYWVARDNDPYETCMERVDGGDVLVVLVAHRYGWEPPDQPVKDGEEAKSITWLECERAVEKGLDVLAFTVEEEAEWPAERRENAEVTKALVELDPTSPEFVEIATEVKRRQSRLTEFKSWLHNSGIRAQFTDPRSVREAVRAALSEWKYERVRPPSGDEPLQSGEARTLARSLEAEINMIQTRLMQLQRIVLPSRDGDSDAEERREPGHGDRARSLPFRIRFPKGVYEDSRPRLGLVDPEIASRTVHYYTNVAWVEELCVSLEAAADDLKRDR